MKPLYTFKIDCLPPSVNHLYRTSWRGGRPIFYKEPKVQEFEQIAGYQLKRLKSPLRGALALWLVFTFKSEKRCAIRDTDNLQKVCIDAIASRGVVENDNQFYEVHAKKLTGAADACSGTIYPLPSPEGE